jgi:hypothetical protein
MEAMIVVFPVSRHCEEQKGRRYPDFVIPGWSEGPDPE